MEAIEAIEQAFQVGANIGRTQAFGLIAGRCTVAQIESLIQIRDEKLYQAVEPTWDIFCEKRLGLSRTAIERQIRRYREFGPNYSRLNSFTPVSPREFKMIAPHVSDDGVSCNGEVIPLDPENAPRLAEAVEILCSESAPEISPAEQAERALAKARKGVQVAVAEFLRLQSMELDEDGRLQLLLAIEGGLEDLTTVRRSAENSLC